MIVERTSAVGRAEQPATTPPSTACGGGACGELSGPSRSARKRAGFGIEQHDSTRDACGARARRLAPNTVTSFAPARA
jgi:hypothetical protein